MTVVEILQVRAKVSQLFGEIGIT